MSILTVDAEGRVALGKDLLQHIGVRPGETVAVDKLPDGRIALMASRPSGKISDVFGFLRRKHAPPLSIEAINEIAAKGWAGRVR